MAKTYQQRKEAVRQEAIDWQCGTAGTDMSWQDIITVTARFERLGRRYGLIGEFRENGII